MEESPASSTDAASPTAPSLSEIADGLGILRGYVGGLPVHLLHRTPYATGTTRLRAFRAAAARSIGPRTLRVLDEHLAHLAA